MILLLDAHALLWWLADDPTLDPATAAWITSPDNDVLVSAATVWEIEIKRALGKLEAPADLLAAIRTSGLDILPITGVDAQHAARLPPHHRDPFDRMLVAQASRLDAVLVSRDGAFSDYPVEVLPA